MFEIWQRRQILKASVVTPALQLMAKLRAEHDSAQAATEPVFRMGQAMEGRRPMRVNLPCVPPHSQTGLPEHVMHLMLDQWASLAGFRYAALHVIAYCVCAMASPQVTLPWKGALLWQNGTPFRILMATRLVLMKSSALLIESLPVNSCMLPLDHFVCAVQITGLCCCCTGVVHFE